MKALKYIAITLLGLVLLILLVSFFLPSKTHVERSIIINAKPKYVFELVSNFKNWNQWSPWYKKDTTAVYTFGEIVEGTGAKFSWKSNNPDVGNGGMEIVGIVPDQKVEIELTFDEFKNRADFTLSDEAGSIKLTWSFDSDTDKLPFYWVPMSKIFGLMMDGMLGPDYEEGLKSIKAIAETKVDLQIGGFDAEIRESKELNYLGIRSQLKEEEIGSTLEKQYTFLLDLINKLAAKQSGPPFTINYAAKGKLFDMAACIGVESPVSSSEPVMAGKLEAGKQLVIKYKGAYEKMGPLYAEGFKYMVQNNLKASGPPMEFYITDPMLEADTSQWLTELVFPFKD